MSGDRCPDNTVSVGIMRVNVGVMVWGCVMVKMADVLGGGRNTRRQMSHIPPAGRPTSGTAGGLISDL